MPAITPDQIERNAQASFNEFGAHINGSGVEAAKDWEAVVVQAGVLDTISRRIASGITAIQEDTTLPDEVRRLRVAELNDTAEGLMRSTEKELQAAIAKVESSLLEAQRVLPESDSGDQGLVRHEIDQLVAAETSKRTSEKAGKSMLVILMELAQQSPKYAAELASDYGKMLMTTAGEQQFIPALFKNVVTLATASSPKGQNAKNALNEMTRLQVKGHLPGLSFAARQRIAAANTPKPVDRAWRPDFIVR